MIRYVFKEDAVLGFMKNPGKADAQVIGDAIAKISAEHAGRLKPRHVWHAAQKPRHPLHKHYEWDVQKAAEAHWDSVSRKLISIVRIDEGASGSPPAYFSVTDKAGRAYRSYSEVIRSLDLQMAILKSAEGDLKAFRNRYQDLEDICDIVRDAQERLATRIRKEEEARPHA